MANWYDFPITQQFGINEPENQGHAGIDLETPDNTPLYFPSAGKVLVAEYKPWGGQVAITTPDGNTESFLHLNKIFVKPGDTLKANQVVGTSGGGVGDQVLYNGKVQAATSQGMFSGYSTGYHTHFAVNTGTSLQNFSLAQYRNQDRINPNAILNALRSGKPAPLPGATDTSKSGGNQDVTAQPLPVGDWGTKVGIFVLALAAVIGGFYLLFQKQADAALGGIAKTAVKVAVL